MLARHMLPLIVLTACASAPPPRPGPRSPAQPATTRLRSVAWPDGGRVLLVQVRDPSGETGLRVTWDGTEPAWSQEVGFQACCGVLTLRAPTLTVEDLDGVAPPELVLAAEVTMVGEAGAPALRGRARQILRPGSSDAPSACPEAPLSTTPSRLWILDRVRTSTEVCVRSSEQVISELRTDGPRWTVTETRTVVPEPTCGEEPGPPGTVRVVQRSISALVTGFSEHCPEPATPSAP